MQLCGLLGDFQLQQLVHLAIAVHLNHENDFLLTYEPSHVAVEGHASYSHVVGLRAGFSHTRASFLDGRIGRSVGDQAQSRPRLIFDEWRRQILPRSLMLGG